jgi:UrcA family protein
MPTNTQHTRLLATLLAFAASVGIAATAQAGDAARSGAHYNDVVVHFADLDLNSTAGNKVLYARLSTAAKRACGNEPGVRDLRFMAHYRACYDQALNGAVDKIGSRQLQALHAASATGNVG